MRDAVIINYFRMKEIMFRNKRATFSNYFTHLTSENFKQRQEPDFF